MREVSSQEITKTVKELVIKANKILPQDLVDCISCSSKSEQNETAKSVLSDLQANIDAASELDIPVCQDTGMAVIFAEIGQDVHISGENFEDAVNRGVAEGYTEGLLRKSVVRDPFADRVNTNDNTPAVIHTRIVPGDKIKITAAPKGFGSENMSALKMFTPSAKKDDIIGFVVDTVKKAGSNPCPPIVVGVGIFELQRVRHSRAQVPLLEPVGNIIVELPDVHHVKTGYESGIGAGRHGGCKQAAGHYQFLYLSFLVSN